MDKPLHVFGDPVDEGALKQIENCLADERAVAGALMADHHLGYAMPIGGVIAYEDAISPSGVGFDIACGNMAVRTDLNVFDLGVDGKLDPEYEVVKGIMRQIQKRISFGVGRSNPAPIDHDLFDDEAWPWLEGVSPGLKKKAEQQLGTVGSGNHYVDLLVDESGKLWVANHFGSRGLGHTIASGFMSLDAGRDFKERVPEGDAPIVFGTDTELGEHYIACMNLAGRYAYAGREEVIKQVVYGVLQASIEDEIHNHHNFAWKEEGHWVVRKGATPLTLERSFIGGSMGDISVIVRGKGDVGSEDGHVYEVEDIDALGSAPHGAGRTMSRTAAAGKLRKMWLCPGCKATFRTDGTPAKATCPHCESVSTKKVRTRDKSTAKIDWDAVRKDLTERNIVVLGGGADEAPQAYKDLSEVLGQHPNIEVVHRLSPIGVVMAGPDTHDPYRD